MRRFITFTVLCALSVVISGCSQSLDKAIIGKFKASVDSSKVSEKDKPMAEMMKVFMKDTSLEIKEGNKAELTALNRKLAGTWKLDGNKLTVTPEQGQNPMKLIVEDGGKTLKPDPVEAKDLPKGLDVRFDKQ